MTASMFSAVRDVRVRGVPLHSCQSVVPVSRCSFRYLAETLNRAADVDSRRRLRSGSSAALLVPMTRRRTLGDRDFPVAAAQVWNSLPTTLTSQSSLLTFRQQLNTFLSSSRIRDIPATLP